MSTPAHPQVVEWRQYTLHPHRRDELIALFEQRFVEPQEAAGMTVMGTFIDLDDPDRFVWMRGFAGMAQRPAALSAFYGGPVWQAHREAANATMVDSDDVLLLKPTPGWTLPSAAPRPAGAPPRGTDIILAVAVPCRDAQLLEPEAPLRSIAAALSRADIEPLAAFITDTTPNNYPRLPVREDARVLLMLGRLRDAGNGLSSRCRHALRETLPAGTTVSRLAPTQRSALPA